MWSKRSNTQHIKLTWDRGKISAINFLYLFTGCLDLARIAGQKTQRVPHAGKTCLEITPETTLILNSNYVQIRYNSLYPFSKSFLFSFPSLPYNPRNLLKPKRRERKPLEIKWLLSDSGTSLQINNLRSSNPRISMPPNQKIINLKSRTKFWIQWLFRSHVIMPCEISVTN